MQITFDNDAGDTLRAMLYPLHLSAKRGLSYIVAINGIDYSVEAVLSTGLMCRKMLDDETPAPGADLLYYDTIKTLHIY